MVSFSLRCCTAFCDPLGQSLRNTCLDIRSDGFEPSAISCNNSYHDIFQFCILDIYVGQVTHYFLFVFFFGDAPMSPLLFVTGFGVSSNATVGFDEQ